VAEWAQLKALGAAPHQLERGRWYAVVDRTKQGMIRVSGPQAVGIPIAEERVRVIKHEPDSITRVPAAAFARKDPGQRITATMGFYGVCPRDHVIDKLSPTDGKALCPECERTYPIEDEQDRYDRSR
jgi:uncharacterized protein YbaR (Trm112 family)